MEALIKALIEALIKALIEALIPLSDFDDCRIGICLIAYHC
jgi:hypothetical protein